MRRVYVVAMVGLPGRGKSSTAHRLQRYLNWVGYDSKGYYYHKYDGGGGDTRKCSCHR